MPFTDDQIAHIEDRVTNLVQRPLTALQAVFQDEPPCDDLILQSITDLERLVAWVRGLRASPDQHSDR